VEIAQTFAALRRNKLGAILISAQIAITLAIICNSLSIVQQRLQRTHRPTGIDEANIFTFVNQWLGDSQELPARIKEDLAALRALPGVLGVAATPSVPLTGRGSNGWVKLRAEQRKPTAYTGLFFVDDHAQAAFGARLMAGRWFTPQEVRDVRATDTQMSATMIVTNDLAHALFPTGDALGKDVYLAETPTRIVGIVDRFQTSMAVSNWGEQFIENSTLLPAQGIGKQLMFVVRTASGRRASVMRAAPNALFSISRNRVIRDVLTFPETRERVYHGDRALSAILGTVSGLLLTMTALGIVGMTSYWVTQRRQQIGVRRALGARRIDILSYFHTENLLIAGTGGLLGIVMAVSGNLWIATNLASTRMSIGYICLGALAVFALSQAAILWPALRATAVPPAIAARGG
jgi:putative ABC transport system permease protein